MIQITRKYHGKQITIKQCNCGVYHKDGKKIRVYVGNRFIGRFNNLARGLMAVDAKKDR